MGYSPKRGKESDMTERLHFHLHGGGNEDNDNLLQKIPCTHCYTQCPQPYSRHRRPTPPPETPGHSQGSLGQSLVGSLLFFPGSWCAQVSVFVLQESVSPVLCKFWQLYGGGNGDVQPTPLFLPGESYGQRNLAGCSPGVARVGHD